MKRLCDRLQIAEALNFNTYPVTTIDLSECDEYGLRGCKCRIDLGEFKIGEKRFARGFLRVYGDTCDVTIVSGASVLKKAFTYYDFLEDTEYAKAPIIQPCSEFAISVYDSKANEAYGVYVIKTGAINKFCTEPITLEKVNFGKFLQIAGNRYGFDYKMNRSN